MVFSFSTKVAMISPLNIHLRPYAAVKMWFKKPIQCRWEKRTQTERQTQAQRERHKVVVIKREREREWEKSRRRVDEVEVKEKTEKRRKRKTMKSWKLYSTAIDLVWRESNRVKEKRDGGDRSQCTVKRVKYERIWEKCEKKNPDNKSEDKSMRLSVTTMSSN